MPRKIIRIDPYEAIESTAERFAESLYDIGEVERKERDTDSTDKTAPSLRDAKPESILPFE